MENERIYLTDEQKDIVGRKCCNCESTTDLQYHHIVPVALGGRSIISNYCCLCYKCHYKLHHGKDSKNGNYSELVRAGKREANKKNLNKMRMLGYDKINDEVIIIPEEAEIVKYIFNEYINTDKGTYLIAKDLNKKGYKGINGKEFAGTTINGILHNRKYTGCYVANKKYTNKIDKINRKNDEKDWIVRENAFEAIIDKETFDKAQEKLNNTALGEHHASRNKYYGHLKCSICGSNAVLRPRKGRNDRYVCGTKRKYGPKACDGPYVSILDIDKYVDELIKSTNYNTTEELLSNCTLFINKDGSLSHKFNS